VREQEKGTGEARQHTRRASAASTSVGFATPPHTELPLWIINQPSGPLLNCLDAAALLLVEIGRGETQSLPEEHL
jgi:hypothetical protein